MKIKLNSIMVEDQAKALAFYTGVLGFKKGKDIPVGEYRWITVVSGDPGAYPDVELALEPNANPAGKAFQEAMFTQGIPLTAFEVDDLAAEVKRLKQKGVQFTMDPTDMGQVKFAIFADTCGNLIQIYQPLNAGG
jgi:catechol 2,3-dioxygenase-like lactoylglutathione lyase family enzyme